MNNTTLISPKEIKRKLDNGDNDFVCIDIRDTIEYKDWNIKGSVNVPVNSFVVEGNTKKIRDSLGYLPKQKKIVTVCARGINSQVVASVLRDMGYKAVSMQNGMKGWNENFEIHEINFSMTMPRHAFTVAQFVRTGKGCLSYIIFNNASRAAAVFEPSVFLKEYIDYINDNHLNVNYVIDSHAHADHFSGGMELAKTFNVDYYVDELDFEKDFRFKSLHNVKNLDLRNINIEIFHTPGHTDGSLSFLIDNRALICGDLLLLEGPGRPDLARDKEETIQGACKMFDSLQNVILKLDDDVKIFPAHFTKSEQRPVTLTLGELRVTNKALTIQDKDVFVSYITEHIPKTPPNFETIKKFNKSGTVIPIDYAEDLEIGPNRCAART